MLKAQIKAMISKMSEMKKNDVARIINIVSDGDIRRRLIELGFAPGTYVKCIRKSPLGDPTAFSVKGGIIALRKEDSSIISVEYSDKSGGNLIWD